MRSQFYHLNTGDNTRLYLPRLSRLPFRPHLASGPGTFARVSQTPPHLLVDSGPLLVHCTSGSPSTAADLGLRTGVPVPSLRRHPLLQYLEAQAFPESTVDRPDRGIAEPSPTRDTVSPHDAPPQQDHRSPPYPISSGSRKVRTNLQQRATRGGVRQRLRSLHS